MTVTQSEIDGANGETTSSSFGASPLARFRSKPMPEISRVAEAGRVENTQTDDEFSQTVQPLSKKGGRKKTGGSDKLAVASSAGSHNDLAGRLIRYAGPLALKYQLNLAHTFTANEAEKWVNASESALICLPLRNTKAEAAGFYAELALALADERQKERGILAEASLKWAGRNSLLVDLKGKK